MWTGWPHLAAVRGGFKTLRLSTIVLTLAVFGLEPGECFGQPFAYVTNNQSTFVSVIDTATNDHRDNPRPGRRDGRRCRSAQPLRLCDALWRAGYGQRHRCRQQQRDQVSGASGSNRGTSSSSRTAPSRTLRTVVSPCRCWKRSVIPLWLFAAPAHAEPDRRQSGWQPRLHHEHGWHGVRRLDIEQQRHRDDLFGRSTRLVRRKASRLPEMGAVSMWRMVVRASR